MSPRQLQDLLLARHSSRVPFDPTRRVTEDELAEIVEAARWAPTAHNMQNYQLIVVDDTEVLTALGHIAAPISREFIIENYAQLARTRALLEQRGTGLLATQFPRAWWAGDPRHAPVDASRTLSDTLAGAPMLIVVVYDAMKRAPASPGDFLGAVSLGCVLENMWIAAHAAGLDAQVVSAVSASTVEPTVRHILAVPEPWRVAFAIRIGHALAESQLPRVRRAPANFVGRNAFASVPAGTGERRHTGYRR